MFRRSAVTAEAIVVSIDDLSAWQSRSRSMLSAASHSIWD
jgi:hypothetical protein